LILAFGHWLCAVKITKRIINKLSLKNYVIWIDEQQVVMLGVIRQEILSGIQHQEQFERIRNKLRPFPDYPITTTDFETAAEFFNRCRTKGIQGSDTDFLICAVANAYDFRIMTFDKDFEYFSKHIDLKVDLLESS